IKTAELIKYINPEKAYILVPAKSPTEKWVKTPNIKNLNEAFQIFRTLNINTELLINDEGTDFTFTPGTEKELSSIHSAQPTQMVAPAHVSPLSRNCGNGRGLVAEPVRFRDFDPGSAQGCPQRRRQGFRHARYAGEAHLDPGNRPESDESLEDSGRVPQGVR
ncbi:MAG: hypothetical protein P8Z74_20410, partial [Acidobacteriota bacterium]